VRGDARALIELIDAAYSLDAAVTVVIAQPGLSRSALNRPIAELLGCTQLYLSETYNSAFRVLCSD